MNSRISVLIVAMAGTALALSACAPRVNQFDVTPRRICQGDSFAITFDVRGQPSFTVSTRGGLLADTTTYSLIVRRNGKEAQARQDVVTFRPNAPQTLIFRTLPLGRDSLIGLDTLPTADWSPAFRVATIASASGRAIVARHASRSVLLSGDGRATSEFAGVLASGGWELRAALLPGEVLGDPQHAPPDRLRINLTVSCNAAGGVP